MYRMPNLSKSIVSGVFWTGLESILNRGFDIVIQLVLARLLFPEDYGVVGMAAVFITLLAVVNDLGLGAALIQKKEKILVPIHFDTAFWTGIGWSILLYTLVYLLLTPLIAAFYKVNQLVEIIPYMALIILISPINNVHRAQLIKGLQFKKLAFINIISTIIAGCVSISLAYFGYGVWALVFYSISKAGVSVPLFFKATKWFPRLKWSKGAFKMLFGFGVFTLGTSIANVFSQQADYLLVGKLVGSAALGYYTFAFLLTNMLRNQIVGIINKVMYPIYVQLQDEPKRLIKLYLKILSTNAMIIYPIVTGLFLFSESIIPLMFGEKWNESIIIIKILCVSVVIQMTINSNQALFRSYGKVKLEFGLQISKTLLFFIPLLFVGTYYYGLEGAAYGYVIATFCSAVLTLFYLTRIFKISVTDLLNALKYPFIFLVFSIATSISLLQYLMWYFCLIYYLVIIIIFYRYFAKREISFLMSVISKRKLSLKNE